MIFDLPRDHALRAMLSLASPAAARARLAIAIFHRVLPEVDPLFPQEVTRDGFDSICRWLAAWFNVLPLDEAVDRLNRRSLPPRALCITFDDGYADNHDIAVPVLQAHGLCATFFIATGFIDGGRMWNDTVVESIRRSPLPAVELGDLGLAGVGHVALDGMAARRAAVDCIIGATKYLDPGSRTQIVERIAERCCADLPSDLMMRSSQVRALLSAGMQVGAHTVSHPILARLDDAAARDEIAASRSALQGLLGEPVKLFAYPNGRPGRDYGPRDVALVQQLGFAAAVTTAPGAARSGSDMRFELPRFTPWDARALPFGLRMLRNLHVAPSRAELALSQSPSL